MYGAMAPDAFNYMFTQPYILYRDFLYDQTHHYFLKIQQAVKYGYENPVPMGLSVTMIPGGLTQLLTTPRLLCYLTRAM